MKKLFLLTFALMLLCTWAVVGANNADDPAVSIKDRTYNPDKAASIQPDAGEKVLVKKEVIQRLDIPTSAIESVIEISKAPYSGPKNVPDQNLILQGGDDCATATAIGGIPFSADGTTTGYNDDYDEVCPYTGSTSPDVVYSYSPAADIDVTITLCTGITDYDTKLYVYENDCVSGTALYCNDDACSAPNYSSYVSELVCVTLTAGNTYFIVVDGYGGGFGNYTIDITECEPQSETLCDDIPSVVWDNGDTDGSNGLSMLSGAGTYRSILDDFVVEESMTIADFHAIGLWNSLVGPQATGYDLILWDDAGGAPGAPIQTLVATLMSETPTGRQWFGRDEYWIDVAVVPVVLGPGTYWLEMHVQGPENYFAMAHTNDGIGPEIIGSECWVYYEDLPPAPQPGSNVFGLPYGLAFCLTSEAVDVFGACCDDQTGDCVDDVNVLDCPPEFRFEVDTDCADLFPLCGEVLPCADFTVIAPGAWAGDNCGAGNDCALRTTEETIYEVIIPNDGLWAIDLCNSSSDTYIFIGTTCCGQELGFQDDSPECGLQSYLELNLTAGTYYVNVENFSSCGTYDLAIYEVGQQQGACCVDANCVGDMTQGDCADLGGLWYQGETCDNFDCPVLGCIVQLPNQVNGLFADYDWPQWMADNFQLGSETTIYGFEFWGGYFSSDVEMDVDDFTVYIRADDAGVPGAALYTFANIPATFREQTGVILFGVHEWRYEICLGEIVLPAGTYWFEVNNATFGWDDVWFWETGDLDPINGIPDGAWNATSDAGPWNVQPGESAFTILCDPCGGPIIGACCDMDNSDCTDNVEFGDCPPEWRFVANAACAELDPPCAPILGACCVQTDCVGDMTLTDCAALSGTWYEGQSCDSFDCNAGALCVDRTNVVYDNGDTDGSNGLSMLSGEGTYRSILDDITVEEDLTISDFHTTLVWNALPGPEATGYDLILWDDNAGIPGAPIMTLDAQLVSEALTGRNWFGRDEWMLSVVFTEVTLTPGVYWLEMHVIGPENAFAMAMADDGIGDEIIGSEVWVNYEDLGGLQPGSVVFGVEYGLNFCLTHTGEQGGCGDYVIGDYNGSDVFNIADVIAAFSKLQTGAPDAFLLCECPVGEDAWAVAFDVNNSCAFNIADVIAAFSKLQTGSPELVACELCPPSGGSPRGGDRPTIVPNLESKVKISNQSGSE